MTQNLLQQGILEVAARILEKLERTNSSFALRIVEFQTAIDLAFLLASNAVVQRNKTDILDVLDEHLSTLAPSISARLRPYPSFVREITTSFQRLAKASPISAMDLSLAYEALYGSLPPDAESRTLANALERRARGVFYTPETLARHLSRRTLAPVLMSTRRVEDILSLRILDPAMGAGILLIAAADVLAERIHQIDPSISHEEALRQVAVNCLYGVDCNPNSVRAAALNIWSLLPDQDGRIDLLLRHFKVGNSLLGSIHAKQARFSELTDTSAPSTSPTSRNAFNKAIEWVNDFPDVFANGRSGFDVILTNPPWGRIRPNFKDFIISINDEFGFYQGMDLRRKAESEEGARSTKDMWNTYSGRMRSYARTLSTLPDYRWQRVKVRGRASGGDSDVYKYFVERSFHLSSTDGILGLIIPSSFRNTEGCTGLRQMLFDGGEVFFLDEFTNRRRHFPIHGMFRFSLIGYRRTSKPRMAIREASFGCTDVVESLRGSTEITTVRNNIQLSAHYLKKVGGPHLIVPEVRSAQEKDLFEKVHDAHPLLGEHHENWNVRFVREVDMTNDSARFVRAETMATFDPQHEKCANDAGRLVLLPVFEGKMIGQFDYAAKGYVKGQGRRAIWRPLGLEEKLISPHYFLPVAKSDRRFSEISIPRACFCDVTGHANRRTVLSAIVPGGNVCGNKVPTCRFDREDDPSLHLIWCAVANSLVIDWIVRRKISTTLNFFYWYSVPFPRLSPQSVEGAALARLAAELSDIETQNVQLYSWLRSATGYQRTTELLRLNAEYRDQLRSRIDDIVAGLFDLTLEERALILRDFPSLSHRVLPLRPLSAKKRARVSQSSATLPHG